MLKRNPTLDLLVLQQIITNRLCYQQILGNESEKIVDPARLNEAGVDLKYFTHIELIKGGEVMRCFEFGIQVEDTQVHIERRGT